MLVMGNSSSGEVMLPGQSRKVSKSEHASVLLLLGFDDGKMKLIEVGMITLSYCFYI